MYFGPYSRIIKLYEKHVCLQNKAIKYALKINL